MGREAGHSFLAKLGKKRLRPGGVEATNWLIEQGHFSSDKKVLEVACNMGTTMIELAKRYGCEIIGVDLDKKALEKANENIKANHLEGQISAIYGNATKLDFPDESFDIVVNEAMLTMLPREIKLKAMKEYYRVLKKGGVLLTHDIALKPPYDNVVQEMQKAINVPATPLEKEDWISLYKEAQFVETDYKTGPMSLMSPAGMIKDEGLFGAMKIVKNAMKAENREMFKKMFKTFKKHKDSLNYIAFCNKK